MGIEMVLQGADFGLCGACDFPNEGWGTAGPSPHRQCHQRSNGLKGTTPGDGHHRSGCMHRDYPVAMTAQYLTSNKLSIYAGPGEIARSIISKAILHL
ncbi:MAG: hypothetical protein H5U19_14570 [Rhodobacteraceae bacterium]|nr:hypothetical protein [Paracoccaceae bacterium]